MKFCEKLDKLMTIAGVLNSRLAKALNVDTSLISRFRTGARKPSLSSDYYKNIAQYFVERSTMNYQRSALFELLQITYDENKNNADFLKNALTKWLTEENSDADRAFDSLLSKISDFEVKAPVISGFSVDTGKVVNARSYYGIEGKRKAVIQFLVQILKNEKPCTLFLYSDECIDWITEDEAYRQKWSLLLANVLMKGNRIKIIHTINRDLCEMIAAIESWLPLYITGSIEPYYYPKYCPGIFRRTIFIAENTIALTSQSIVSSEAKSANIIYTDKKMLNALTIEFNAYLDLCKPLMQILTKRNYADFLDIKNKFEKQEGNVIYKSNLPSFTTIPKDLFYEIFTFPYSDDDVKKGITQNFDEQTQCFLNNIENNTYTEIVAIPEIDDINNKKIPVPLSEIINGEPLYYTKEQFVRHLKNVIYMLENYNNYHFYFSSDKCNNNSLLAKDNIGSIIVKLNTPSVIFAFNHEAMTNAMYAYLEKEESKINKKNIKHLTIKQLEEIISNL